MGSPPPVAGKNRDFLTTAIPIINNNNYCLGRRHETIQTETYLEELYVNPPVEDMCTQTDLFIERPVSPFYVPAKTGADVETQIYPGDVGFPNKHYIFSVTYTIISAVRLRHGSPTHPRGTSW